MRVVTSLRRDDSVSFNGPSLITLLGSLTRLIKVKDFYRVVNVIRSPLYRFLSSDIVYLLGYN